MDIFPTMAELTNQKIPKELIMDGKSLLPVLMRNGFVFFLIINKFSILIFKRKNATSHLSPTLWRRDFRCEVTCIFKIVFRIRINRLQLD
jgi:hypothetical protein